MNRSDNLSNMTIVNFIGGWDSLLLFLSKLIEI